MIALIVREGVPTIARMLSAAGWKLLWLAPLQAAPLLLDVLGWHALILAPSRISGLFLIACVRQAINRLLPVASVGGEIVGVRLLMQQGVAGITATASVVAEVMLSLFAQYFFVAAGVVCLLVGVRNSGGALGLLVGLAVTLVPLVLMIFALRDGRVFARLEGIGVRIFARWLAEQRDADYGPRLDERIRTLFLQRWRVFRGVWWPWVGLLVGCSETWLALRWLGHPVGIAQAVVIESLAQVAKSALFMVPSALGVQEAGLIGAGHLVGLGADAALSLSLAKRMREILVGVPALLAWQWIENRQPRLKGGSR